jgi:hypothetical protein
LGHCVTFICVKRKQGRVHFGAVQTISMGIVHRDPLIRTRA